MYKITHNEYRFIGVRHKMREWIHVEDAARLVRLASTAIQATYEIYDGGHTHATTHEVLTILVTPAGMLGEALFNDETHIGNPRRLAASCGRTRSQLAWTPAVSLGEGLRLYAAWFKTEIKA